VKRAVSILEVAEPAIWPEIEDALGPYEAIDATHRRIDRGVERTLLEALRQRGLPVLVRYARHGEVDEESPSEERLNALASLSRDALAVLHRAQRHARDHVVVGAHTWDPEVDAPLVDALYGSGLLESIEQDRPTAPREGRYRLPSDLPPPPPLSFDFAEAILDAPDDLPAPGPGPVDVLHDMAALSAALVREPARRTQAGTLERSSVKRLGERLASDSLRGGALDVRWTRALTALEALGAVAMDPLSRALHPEPGLERLLLGRTTDAVDRLVHRLVDPDLQAVLPAVRAALHDAGDGAVDEVIFLDILGTAHRDIIFTPWYRGGGLVYPGDREDRRLPWIPEAFERIEHRLIEDLLRVIERLGLVRRAPGVFAATPDGRIWADGEDPPSQPVWVTSDLEVWVPPASITPWERYQIERLGRCLARDVVDRYRLEKDDLVAWLATHELADALALLERRAPALPAVVRDTLEAWNRSATRIVLTVGLVESS
jgi:hypothetical protein